MKALVIAAAFGTFAAIAFGFGAGGGATGDKKPPSIVYGENRTSNKWVDTPTGQVAVDEGIEWQGVRVYIALTHHLVAVDAKTDKRIWDHNISAFWNAMTIKEVEFEKSKKVWVVELRTTSKDALEKDLTAVYELKNGKEITKPRDATLGKELKPRKEYHGDASQLTKPFTVTLTTAENWDKLRAKMFAEPDKAAAPLAKDIDFQKEFLLVISDGASSNCKGISCQEAFENDQRIIVRIRRHTFQTLGAGVSTRPYGIMVLPRTDKSLVVENNRQIYIGGPPIWTESKRFDKLPDATKELDPIP